MDATVGETRPRSHTDFALAAGVLAGVFDTLPLATASALAAGFLGDCACAIPRSSECAHHERRDVNSKKRQFKRQFDYVIKKLRYVRKKND